MTQRPGAVTLLTVFMASSIVFLLLLGDNLHAVAERQRANDQVQSEQAFYASQSCLEDAYLQLRTNADYSGVSGVQVGTATCGATISPITPNSPNGTVTSTGSIATITRSIASSYHDAGGITSAVPSMIMHVVDHSGSMGDFTCTNSRYTTQGTCEGAHGQWVTKLSLAKQAANNFDTLMISSTDAIGLEGFGSGPDTPLAPTHDIATITNAINHLSANGTTDIVDAITTAASQLPAQGNTIRAMILLTDGLPNHPNSPCVDETQCTIDAAKAAKNQGILVFVIGLGGDVNTDLLQNHIATTPLAYYSAADPTELQNIYNAIAQQIRTYNISQGSWNEK